MHLCNVPKTLPLPLCSLTKAVKPLPFVKKHKGAGFSAPCFCALSQDEKKLKKIKVFFENLLTE